MPPGENPSILREIPGAGEFMTFWKDVVLFANHVNVPRVSAIYLEAFMDFTRKAGGCRLF
jgi:hypothetical protein